MSIYNPGIRSILIERKCPDNFEAPCMPASKEGHMKTKLLALVLIASHIDRLAFSLVSKSARSFQKVCTGGSSKSIRNFSAPLMPRGVKKEHLPEKICVVCNRSFTWRKKWERCWDEVTTCSKSCNSKRRLANQQQNAAHKQSSWIHAFGGS